MTMKITTVALALSVMSAHAIIPNHKNIDSSQLFNLNLSTVINAKGDRSADLVSDEPANWFNLSPSIDLVEGVSTEAAYEKFGQPKNEIIVAVIDSGVDVNHEDLQGKVWINKKEIPNNGIDDDKNGYIDDVFGWNFIGSDKAMAIITKDDLAANGYILKTSDMSLQVNGDTLEITREVVRLKKLKDELSTMGQDLSKEDAQKLETLTIEVQAQKKEADANFNQINTLRNKFLAGKEILIDAGVEVINQETVSAFEPVTTEQKKAKDDVLSVLAMGFGEEKLQDYYDYYYYSAFFYYNENSDTRKEIVGDDYTNQLQKVYGNNDVIGPDSSHGTHVAGTIAANRDNNIGMKGVASNVKIMAIRCVPNGDERDKDVANSIRYAVDNGAKVINMSFGKAFSPYKSIVMDAIKYAEAKGVLMVHAAGNSNQNNDTTDNFPTDENSVNNWIEVGASSYKYGENLAASFSNFGLSNVDLFAPGVNVYATFPNNAYKAISGTSMASPVTAGVAALVLGYDNEISPRDLKDLLLTTTTRYPGLYIFKRDLGEVHFSDLSRSGGVVNVLNALENLN